MQQYETGALSHSLRHDLRVQNYEMADETETVSVQHFVKEIFKTTKLADLHCYDKDLKDISRSP